MIRKILILALVALLCACSSDNNNDLIVNVEVENMTSSKVDVIIDRTTGFTIQLDKNGKGSLRMPGYDNVYAQIIYNQAGHQVFMQAGHDNTIRFDARKFSKEMRVEGDNKEADDYLLTVSYPPLNSYEMTWSDFKAEINKLTDEACRLLKMRNLEETCPQFAKIEEQRIRYIYAQTILTYPMGHQMKTKDESYTPEEDIFTTLKSFVRENEEMAFVPEYRDFLRFAIPMMLKHDGKDINNSYDRTVETMRYVAHNFNSQLLKQTMIRSLALEYFQNSGTRNTDELQRIANNYLTDSLIVKDYKNAVEQYDITAVGKKSPDFNAEDVNGNIVSLNDLKGKFLYIDVWATWCGPCKKEMAYMPQLEEKFKGSNIVFVALNTDKTKTDWRKMVGEQTMPGTQLWIGDNSDFANDYGIDGIPRYIILSPEGRIIDANAVRPSSEDIENVLRELIENNKQ